MFFQFLRNLFQMREPDVILRYAVDEEKSDGEEKRGNDIYLKRWYLIRPYTWGFNIYLHQFMGSDEDRSLHDHPWWSLGIILWGSYLEHMPKDPDKWIIENDRTEIIKQRYPLVPVYRKPEAIHRIELLRNPNGTEKSVWTLFITGPKIREWGFWCPFGFRHNYDFLDRSKTRRGIGCD